MLGLYTPTQEMKRKNTTHLTSLKVHCKKVANIGNLLEVHCEKKDGVMEDGANKTLCETNIIMWWL